jgi:hypothetical protein
MAEQVWKGAHWHSPTAIVVNKIRTGPGIAMMGSKLNAQVIIKNPALQSRGRISVHEKSLPPTVTAGARKRI